MGQKSLDYRKAFGSPLDLGQGEPAKLIVDAFKLNPGQPNGGAAVITWLAMGTPSLDVIDPIKFQREMRKLN